jgi:hypothetical protein
MADLEQLFKRNLNNPDEAMGQQYSYLRDMNRTPKIEMYDLPIGINGNYNGWENRIRLSPLADDPKSTVSHELQHAVDSILDGQRITTQRKGSSMTPQERQFLEAHQKLNEETKIPLGDLSRYRRSPGESRAFGVGNMNYPHRGAFEGTPHLDATMATEQAILLDLAKRALKSDSAPAQVAPKTDPIDSAINASSEKLVQLKDWAMRYLKK